MKCILCSSDRVSEFATTNLGKQFFKCDQCQLAFLNPKQQLGFFEEKARYQTHNNDIRQPGYRRFLSQMWEPLKAKLPKVQTPPLKILDFGSGPTTAFAQLAAEDGYEVASYDPYFFNDKDLLNNQYDVIWCSEVFEHFNSPKDSIPQVLSLLKRGGLLAVMTDSYPQDPEAFKKWGYHNDPTHICFYAPETMQWVAESWGPGLGIESVSKRVTFFIPVQN